MNKYKVTLTLDVVAGSIEEAKQRFVEKIEEGKLKETNIELVEMNRHEKLNSLEEIEDFLNRNSTETVVNYIMSHEDYSFEEMVTWGKTNGLHKHLSKEERRKLITQTIEDIPKKLISERGFGAYLQIV